MPVYRPARLDFPRARGRDGIEFRADGSYIDWAVGRATPASLGGRWQLDSGGRFRLEAAAGQQRMVEVLQVTPDRLELRTGSGP